MGDVVNLRLARKAKARTEKDAQAAENRTRYGQSKQERVLNKALGKRQGKHLDSHKMTRDPDSQ
jgi:hypothetical protein